MAIISDAGAPVTGPFSITVAFSEPVTGFELEDLVVGNGSASELQGNNASYMVTITPAASGTVTVDIAAGAARDAGGNPSAAAVQFSIVADLTPVAGSAGDLGAHPRGPRPGQVLGPEALGHPKGWLDVSRLDGKEVEIRRSLSWACPRPPSPRSRGRRRPSENRTVSHFALLVRLAGW